MLMAFDARFCSQWFIFVVIACLLTNSVLVQMFTLITIQPSDILQNRVQSLEANPLSSYHQLPPHNNA